MEQPLERGRRESGAAGRAGSPAPGLPGRLLTGPPSAEGGRTHFQRPVSSKWVIRWWRGLIILTLPRLIATDDFLAWCICFTVIAIQEAAFNTYFFKGKNKTRTSPM